MRRTLGWLLFGAGVVGLSYWGHENHAKTIEAFVTDEAATIADGSRHGITPSVSGRDVTLEGFVHNEAEKERILNAATELKGYRIVHDKLTMLPKQDIYSFRATKTDAGIGEIAGFIPDETTRGSIAKITGTDGLDALKLAAGEPNAAWAAAAGAGLMGLDGLQKGALTIEGQNVTLEGTVDTDMDLAALKTAAGAGPEGYNWDLTGVNVMRPNVDTYQMVAQKAGSGWSFDGNMPDQAAADTVMGGIDSVETKNIVFAANSPDGWSDRLGGAMSALDNLKTGRIEMRGDDVRIIGEAETEDDFKAYEMAIATIGSGAVVASDITVLTPAAAAIEPDTIDEPVVVEETATMEEPLIVEETATIEEPAVEEPAVIEEPVIVEEVATTEPAEPVNVTPDFDIALDPISGLTVSGDVPAELDAAKIAEILGVLRYSGETTAIEGADGEAQSEKLAKLRPVVGEFENLNISFDDQNMALVGETLFDADPARMQEVLSEIVAEGDSLQISGSTKAYDDGFRRENALTGKAEIFTSGYWIPEFDASALTAAECAQRTEAAVNETKISFRPGSAEIDSVSRSILNSLSSIIGSCLKREPDTRILIGGHTDAVGSEEYNLNLSNDRAANVLAALTERGLPKDQLAAQGFGELQPIADNTTDDGRARNRRTTFEWIN